MMKVVFLVCIFSASVFGIGVGAFYERLYSESVLPDYLNASLQLAAAGQNEKPVSLKAVEKEPEYKAFEKNENGWQNVPKDRQEAWQKTRRVALIVGVGNYLKESRLNSLKYTSNDSQKMASVLKDIGHFDEVVLLNDDTGFYNNRYKPTKENIIREFRRLVKTDPQTFLFYFSGHGFEEKEENIVALSDTVKEAGTSRNVLNVAKEIIEPAKLWKLRERQEKNRKGETEEDEYNPPGVNDGIPQIMVFLDACRETIDGKKGGEKGTAFGEFKLPERLRGAKGVGIFLGTSPGGFSYEDSSLGGGVFTEFLVKGLSGEVQNRGGEYVTFNDLKLYVEQEMKAYIKAKGKNEQAPYSRGDYTGDFLLAVGRPKGSVHLSEQSYRIGSENAEGKRLFDSQGRLLRLAFFNSGADGEAVPASIDGISRIVASYHDKCFENNGISYTSRKDEFDRPCLSLHQFDRKGNLEFVHEIRYRPDRGWEILRPYLDETGTKNAVREKETEIQYQRTGYDFNGNPILDEYLGRMKQDEKGSLERLLPDKEGIARVVQNFDVLSNKTLEEYYDENKNLKPDKNGIARTGFVYDSVGNPLIKLYTNEKSRQAKDGYGIYKTAYVYDYSKNPYGIIKEKVQFAKTEEEMAEGEDGLARFEYEYDENCLSRYSHTKEDAKNLNCVKLISRKGKNDQFKGDRKLVALGKFSYDEEGRLSQEEYFRDSELPMIVKNGITKIQYKYDASCWSMMDAGRKLKCRETDESCMASEKIHSTCVSEIRTFNSGGLLESDFGGVAVYKFRYDPGCLQFVPNKERCFGLESALDIKEKPTVWRKERKEEQFDENCLRLGKSADGCRTLIEFYGADGRLKGDSYGIARTVYKYDDRGNKILEETYGADGKLKGNYQGIAREVTKYDENCLSIVKDANRCKTISEAYGEDGRLKANYNGIARYVYKYDENCLSIIKDANRCKTISETYGEDGRLKANYIGIAREVNKYDENCLHFTKYLYECRTLIETYGEDGKLKADRFGIARRVYQYDNRRNQILEESYGENGKLKGNSNGIARVVSKYDDRGYMTLLESYGEDGKLKSNPNGIARVVRKYDERGNQTLSETYGADGKLKEHNISKYDDQGNLALYETYGADGKLKDDSYGIARKVHKYDDRGNRTLYETYGEDGKLKGDSTGIARYVYKYDENCLSIMKNTNHCKTISETYGEDGKLKGDYDGIARQIYKYSENCLRKEKEAYVCYSLQAYYGADGKLKGGSDGIARVVSKYDERGHKTLIETFGEDGKLKGDFYGIARYVNKYDDRGIIILEETYGEDGKLKAKYDAGIARKVYQYDDRGNQTLKEIYGKDGKLKGDYEGIARVVSKYDDRGNRTLNETYGEDGKLKGYQAREVTKYDENCLKQSKEFRKKNNDCISYFESHNEQGRVRSAVKSTFDANGNYLTRQNLEERIGAKWWTALEDRMYFYEKLKDVKERKTEIREGKPVEIEETVPVLTDANYSIRFPNPRGADGKKNFIVELDRFYRPSKVRFEP